MLQIGYLLHEISLPNSFLSAGGAAWCGLMSINILKTVPNYAEEDIFFFLALRSVWQNKCTACTRSNLQIFHASWPPTNRPTNYIGSNTSLLEMLFGGIWGCCALQNILSGLSMKYFSRSKTLMRAKKPSPLCETCQLFRTNQFQLTREITHEKSCRPSGIYAYLLLPTTSEVLEIASYWCDLY